MRWDVGLAGFGDRRAVDPPIAWHGGFADTEGKFNDLHLLISPDGSAWREAAIPFSDKHGFDMVAFRSGLVLADHHPVFQGMRYGIWMSGDGFNWRYLGSVTTRAMTLGYDIGGALVALGDRLGILAFIGPPVGDGGVRPGGAGVAGVGEPRATGGAAVGTDEIGTWAWTSADGRTWQRQRVIGAGTQGIQRMVVGPDGFAGFHSGFDTGPLMHSNDGINWTRLAALPDAIDPSTVGYLAATDDGYVVVTLPYAPAQGDRPFFSIWRVSKDGVFTHVLDRPHAELIDIQASGPVVVITANEGDFAPELPFGIGFALVSTDSGATFQLSAGWPAMRSAGCLSSAAIHDRVVIAGTGCNPDGPAFLRAELP